MKHKTILYFTLMLLAMLTHSGCQKFIDTPPENRSFTGGTDYTVSSNMILPLIGVYTKFCSTEWGKLPTDISERR